MKKSFVWTSAAVLALGLAASAQTPPPTPQPDRPRDTQAQADDRQKDVTFTGCVQRADMSPSASGSTSPSGSTPSSARSGSDDAKFILTSASMGSGSGSPTGTSGSTPSATAGSAGIGATYKLKGEEDDLAKFIGQRVEVRGQLEDKMSGSSTPEASAPSGSARMSGDAKVLKVSSVRATSGSCESK